MVSGHEGPSSDDDGLGNLLIRPTHFKRPDGNFKQRSLKQKASMSPLTEAAGRFHLELDDFSPRGRLRILGAEIASSSASQPAALPAAEHPPTASVSPRSPQPPSKERSIFSGDSLPVQAKAYGASRQESLLRHEHYWRVESFLADPLLWLRRLPGTYRRWLLLIVAVTIANGLLSIVLLESRLGAASLDPLDRFHRPTKPLNARSPPAADKSAPLLLETHGRAVLQDHAVGAAKMRSPGNQQRDSSAGLQGSGREDDFIDDDADVTITGQSSRGTGTGAGRASEGSAASTRGSAATQTAAAEAEDLFGGDADLDTAAEDDAGFTVPDPPPAASTDAAGSPASQPSSAPAPAPFPPPLSSAEFLSAISLHWHVTPLPHVPGAFALQRPDDFSCALLLQHACYLFMMGRTPLHNQYTGVWLPAEDLPGLGEALNPPLSEEEIFNATEAEDGGTSPSTGSNTATGSQEAGTGKGSASSSAFSGSGSPSPSLAAVRRSPFKPGSRDFSLISLREDRCSLFRPAPRDEEGFQEGDLGDFTVLAARANKTYGRLAGGAGLRGFIAGSSHTARKRLREALLAGAARRWEVEYESDYELEYLADIARPDAVTSGEVGGSNGDDAVAGMVEDVAVGGARRRGRSGAEASRAFAVVGRFDSHVGHFGAGAATLLEATQHLPWSWALVRGNSSSSSNETEGERGGERVSVSLVDLAGVRGGGEVGKLGVGSQRGGKASEDDWSTERRRLLALRGEEREGRGPRAEQRKARKKRRADSSQAHGRRDEQPGEFISRGEAEGALGSLLEAAPGRKRRILGEDSDTVGGKGEEGSSGDRRGEASKDQEEGSGEESDEREEEEESARVAQLDLQGRPYALFFPSEKHIKANWTAGLSRLLMGPLSASVAGKLEGTPMCFRGVVLILNGRARVRSVDALRERAWAVVDAGVASVSEEAWEEEEAREREEKEREREKELEREREKMGRLRGGGLNERAMGGGRKGGKEGDGDRGSFQVSEADKGGDGRARNTEGDEDRETGNSMRGNARAADNEEESEGEAGDSDAHLPREQGDDESGSVRSERARRERRWDERESSGSEDRDDDGDGGEEDTGVEEGEEEDWNEVQGEGARELDRRNNRAGEQESQRVESAEDEGSRDDERSVWVGGEEQRADWHGGSSREDTNSLREEAAGFGERGAGEGAQSSDREDPRPIDGLQGEATQQGGAAGEAGVDRRKEEEEPLEGKGFGRGEEGGEEGETGGWELEDAVRVRARDGEEGRGREREGEEGVADGVVARREWKEGQAETQRGKEELEGDEGEARQRLDRQEENQQSHGSETEDEGGRQEGGEEREWIAREATGGREDDVSSRADGARGAEEEDEGWRVRREERADRGVEGESEQLRDSSEGLRRREAREAEGALVEEEEEEERRLRGERDDSADVRAIRRQREVGEEERDSVVRGRSDVREGDEMGGGDGDGGSRYESQNGGEISERNGMYEEAKADSSRTDRRDAEGTEQSHAENTARWVAGATGGERGDEGDEGRGAGTAEEMDGQETVGQQAGQWEDPGGTDRMQLPTDIRDRGEQRSAHTGASDVAAALNDQAEVGHRMVEAVADLRSRAGESNGLPEEGEGTQARRRGLLAWWRSGRGGEPSANNGARKDAAAERQAQRAKAGSASPPGGLPAKANEKAALLNQQLDPPLPQASGNSSQPGQAASSPPSHAHPLQLPAAQPDALQDRWHRQALHLAKIELAISASRLQEALKAIARVTPRPQEVMRQRRVRAGVQFQVTVVEREGQRSVGNMPQLVATVRELFPRQRLAVVRFAQAPFLEQVAVMQRTALLVSMHGATLSNVIFLPRGAVVLELFPFKFSSEAYGSMCQRAGVKYFSWKNTHRSNSSYTDGCMDDPRFASLGVKECWKMRPCLFCARDHSITTVHTGELERALLPAQKAVRAFLFEQRMRQWDDV